MCRPTGAACPRAAERRLAGNSSTTSTAPHATAPKGEGKPADRLVGGHGTLNTDKPVMTVGSYWAYATTIYDYINRSMPFVQPQSLKPDEVYSITAYVLYLNGIVARPMMDATSLPSVEMPNRKGFVFDPRPDLHNPACKRIAAAGSRFGSGGGHPRETPACSAARALIIRRMVA